MNFEDYVEIPSKDLEKYRPILDYEFGLVVIEDDGNWVKLEFLRMVASDDDSHHYQKVWEICGPGGKDHPLREGRHSYFGNKNADEEGYIFYLNKKFMLETLEIANEYFDLD